MNPINTRTYHLSFVRDYVSPVQNQEAVAYLGNAALDLGRSSSEQTVQTRPGVLTIFAEPSRLEAAQSEK